MIVGVDTYSWPGPLGFYFRQLDSNVLAGFVQAGLAAAAVSVLIPVTRHWWERKIRALWAKHGHHVHAARDWWHLPVLEQQAAHHAEQMAAHARLHEHLGITNEGHSLTDPILDRITYNPVTVQLEPIPWPAGLAPTPDKSAPAFDGSLPPADVLVVTYTAAEGRALADVLTPGVQSTDWIPYVKDWAEYEPLLTGRSPARDAHRLGSWHLTTIGDKRVVCFKSELHPATDGPKLPLAKLWAQIIDDVTTASTGEPLLVITTGTAGGVGAGTQLGDIAVARAVRWDCEKQFAHEPWAQTAYPCSPLSLGQADALASIAPLVAANFDRIPAEYRTRPAQTWTQETTVTTDFFAMGDTTDSYGLIKAAADCRAVEMDDAACGLAISALTDPPTWFSVRNASDPVMDGTLPLAEQSKQASAIYEKWGYTTTIGSAIACWALITAN
jgi:hypothetical protein